MTLLLADDQSIIPGGLEAMLAQDDEVKVVGHASTGEEAERASSHCQSG